MNLIRNQKAKGTDVRTLFFTHEAIAYTMVIWEDERIVVFDCMGRLWELIPGKRGSVICIENHYAGEPKCYMSDWHDIPFVLLATSAYVDEATRSQIRVQYMKIAKGKY